MQLVGKVTTMTTLASSLNPSNSGQSVTFTASVTPQFGGSVTGTMSFYDGTTVLKTVTMSHNVAKFILPVHPSIFFDTYSCRCLRR